MNLTNYYWYFKSAVPSRICDDISKYGKQLQEQMAAKMEIYTHLGLQEAIICTVKRFSSNS